MQMAGTLPMHQTGSSSSFFCAKWAHLGSGPHQPFPDSETPTGKGRFKKKIKSDCNQYKMHTSKILFHSLTIERTRETLPMFQRFQRTTRAGNGDLQRG